MLCLTPFLLFDGNCAQAMAFYHACFGGELTLTKLRDTPMKDGFSAEQHNKITNSYLKSDHVEFSATDWLHPTRLREPGNTTAMYVMSDEPAELRIIFDKLSDGANKEFFVDLRQMPFGLYGRFTD